MANVIDAYGCRLIAIAPAAGGLAEEHVAADA